MKCKQCNIKEVTKYPKTQLCVPCYALQDSRKLTLKDGRWSKYSEICKVCKSNQRPHHGRGFCRNCYKNSSQAKKKTNYKPSSLCTICNLHTCYYWQDIRFPVCKYCYPSWRANVPCDGCGQPATENAVETEDNNTIYWWHYACWERACSTTQIEQLKALAGAL